MNHDVKVENTTINTTHPPNHEQTQTIHPDDDIEIESDEEAFHNVLPEKHMTLHEEANKMALEGLRAALKINEELRNKINDKLLELQAAYMKNLCTHAQLRTFISQYKNGKHSNSKKYASMLQKRTADLYFFIDKNGEQPPENIDTIQKRIRRRGDKMPLVYKTKKWTQTEAQNLKKGVIQQNQEILLADLLKKYEESNDPSILERMRKEMEQVKQMEEMEINVEKINWDSLASMFVPTRSGIECKLYWMNELSPTINKSKWTSQEDKLLLKLAKANKGHNWEEIAQKLGTGRTPLQCFKRYQRSLNNNMMKSKWTEEEDRLLMQAVEHYGERNWQQVANCLEGRTGQQCLHRWTKTLNPKIKRGRWTEEEDKRLTLAVHAYENYNWIKIQKHVPGRTDVQCRERWCNILDPKLKDGPWTKEEDELLMKAIEKHGIGKWSKIAEEVPSRTDNQCWRRWKQLNPEQAEPYRKKIKKKEKALVRNFVGREKERPELDPDDFDLDIPIEDTKVKKRKRSNGYKSKKKPKTAADEKPTSLPPISPQPLPIITPEMTIRLQQQLLAAQYPMHVGIKQTPFVNTSLSMLKYMQSYDPMNRETQDIPNTNNIFVQPIIDSTIQGLTPLPCIPATKLACYALGRLHKVLYNNDDEDEKEVINVEEEEEEEDDFDIPDEELSDFENDFEEGYKYDPNNFIGSLDVDRPVNFQSTEENTQTNTAKIPSYDVLEFKYLDKDIVKTKEFKKLASVFNALFQHSMHRVMLTTSRMFPHLVRKRQPLSQPLYSPKVPIPPQGNIRPQPVQRIAPNGNTQNGKFPIPLPRAPVPVSQKQTPLQPKQVS